MSFEFEEIDKASKPKAAYEDLEHFKFAKTRENKVATRVIIAEPSTEEQEGPSNLQLSNNNVEENQPQGTLIGTLSSSAPAAPIVYTIEQDLANAFQIVGNQLQSSRVLDQTLEPVLNVAVRVTDNNGAFITENFTINVLEVSGFRNTKSYGFNGTSSFIIFNELLHGNGGSAQPNFSIGFWTKYTFHGANKTFISTFNADGTTVGGLSFKIVNSSRYELRLEKSNGNEKVYQYQLPSGFNTQDWNLIGITFSRGLDQLNLYINAVLQSPVTISSDDPLSTQTVPNNDTYIGRASTGGQYFQGLIDEIFFSPDFYEAADWVLAYNDGKAVNLDNLSKNIDNWYRAEDDVLPIILDVKGSNNGAETGITITNDSPSEFVNNFSVLFDGATNYFVGSGVPDFTAAKSISFWLKRNIPLQTDLLISYGAVNNSSNNSAKIYLDSQSRLTFRIDSPSGDIIRRWSLTNSIEGNWTHIVITASDFTDSNTVQCYKNGILLAANQNTNSLTTLPTITNKLAFGAGITGTNLYSGNLDEYSVFNKELSSTEVEELYALNTTIDLDGLSFNADLIQWFRFGDKNNNGSVMLNQKNTDEAVVMIGYDDSFYVNDTV